MRPFAVILPLLLISSAQACINDIDSDSLALQAKKLPDTLRVITGRFERNPPLYYEIRIRRSLVQLKQNPRQYNLYDDIGAAYDRLHRSNDALRIMEQKRALLPAYTTENAATKEAWYRYYANAGTFRAHRWLSAGAKVQNISEMKRARNFIKRAIEIKPDAHFGREKYQLMTMDWIIAMRTRPAEQRKTLGEWISHRDNWGVGPEFYFPHENQARQSEAVEGLAGLIVLGAAWQSPDVFEALANSLNSKEGMTLRYLALLRCRELLTQGKASLSPGLLQASSIVTPGFLISHGGVGINETNEKTLQQIFPTLRSEADLWAGKRTAYMLTQLQKGSHPDTNPTFWQDWKSTAPPSLDVRWYNKKNNAYLDELAWQQWRPWFLFSLIVAGLVTICVLLLRIESRYIV